MTTVTLENGRTAHPRVFVVESTVGTPIAVAVCPTREVAAAYAAHLTERWGFRHAYLALPWVETVPERAAPAPPAEGEP
jgi:hypothetical protein